MPAAAVSALFNARATRYAPAVQLMTYISTRGRTPPMGFRDAVMTGLAPDGGLLIPEHIPPVADRLSDWTRLSYQDLTFEVLRLFTDLPDGDLRDLITRSYAVFRHPEIAPAWPVGPVHILELFHGPTLAFKDMRCSFSATSSNTSSNTRAGG